MRFCRIQWSSTRFYGSLSVYSRPLPSEKNSLFAAQLKIDFRRFLFSRWPRGKNIAQSFLVIVSNVTCVKWRHKNETRNKTTSNAIENVQQEQFSLIHSRKRISVFDLWFINWDCFFLVFFVFVFAVVVVVVFIPTGSVLVFLNRLNGEN